MPDDTTSTNAIGGEPGANQTFTVRTTSGTALVSVSALKAGARIAQHKAPGQLTIQTVSGYLRCQAARTDTDLPAGHLLALEQNVSHEVEAIEESVFLLTIASPADDPNAG